MNCNINLIPESWLPVAGYEDLYEVSNFGRVKSLRSGKLLSQFDRGGYKKVHICCNGKDLKMYVHRLTAEAFHENPENLPVVNHMKGLKYDNRAVYLEWCSHSENMKHAYRMGLMGKLKIA